MFHHFPSGARQLVDDFDGVVSGLDGGEVSSASSGHRLDSSSDEHEDHADDPSHRTVLQDCVREHKRILTDNAADARDAMRINKRKSPDDRLGRDTAHIEVTNTFCATCFLPISYYVIPE
jgi:hypothetical protein